MAPPCPSSAPDYTQQDLTKKISDKGEFLALAKAVDTIDLECLINKLQCVNTRPHTFTP